MKESILLMLIIVLVILELTVPIHLDYKGLGCSEGSHSQSSRGNAVGPAEIWVMWHIFEDHYCNVVLCLDVSRDAQ